MAERPNEVSDSSDLSILKISLKSIVYIDGMYPQWLIWKSLWQEAPGMVYYIIFFLFSLVNLILNLTSPVRRSILRSLWTFSWKFCRDVAIICFLREPPDYARCNDMNSLSCHRLQITLSTILSCRMLLRLRDYAKRIVFGETGLSTNTSAVAAVDIPLRFVNGGSDIE